MNENNKLPDIDDVLKPNGRPFGEPINEDPDMSELGYGYVMGEQPQRLDTLLSKNFSDDIWLVENLIPIGGITVVSAQPRSYKTWFLLDLAIQVASGNKLFGEFPTKQTGVLIIDEENGERLLQQRLVLLKANSELPIYFLSDKGFLLGEDPVAQVIEYCKLHDIGLVTFDSLVRIHDANENDAKDMAEVFRCIRELSKNGLTVLITHHNRKPSNNGGGDPSFEMRGSSDILAALDCHLALIRQDDNRVLLQQTKVRFTEEMPTIELHVVNKGGSVEIRYIGSRVSETKRDATRKAVLALLIEHTSLNQRQLLAGLDEMEARVNARTLREVLKQMMADEQIESSPGNRKSIIYQLKHKETETTE